MLYSAQSSPSAEGVRATECALILQVVGLSHDLGQLTRIAANADNRAEQLSSDLWRSTSTGRNRVDKSPIRVLVVDDYEVWRRFISSLVSKVPNVQLIGEVSDGIEAVRKAEELQPDLILLDIGLPTLDGIEAARRIREVSPASKILFVSENRSPEVAEQALNHGAGGYVVKSDAAEELLPAIRAILEGKRFISTSLAGHFLILTTLSPIQIPLSWMVTLILGIR